MDLSKQTAFKSAGAGAGGFNYGMTQDVKSHNQCGSCYLRHEQLPEKSDCSNCFTGRVVPPNRLVLPAEWSGVNALSAFTALKQLPVDMLVDKSLVIDLSEVTHLDSSGLGAIIGLRKKLGKHKVDIQLTGASSFVKRLLETANFDRLFSILD